MTSPSKVTFKEEDHSYWVNGEQLPSVTTILKDMGFIDSTWFTDYARERGKLVHLACHLDDQDSLDDSTLDPVLKPYLEAYRRFKFDTGFIVSQSETPLASETYRFAGTFDKAGSFRDISCALVDIKTGIVAPWTAIQTAAYQILKNSPYRRFGLQLKDNGKYKLTEFKDRNDRNIFLGAVSCWHWKAANLKGGKP